MVPKYTILFFQVLNLRTSASHVTLASTVLPLVSLNPSPTALLATTAVATPPLQRQWMAPPATSAPSDTTALSVQAYPYPAMLEPTPTPRRTIFVTSAQLATSAQTEKLQSFVPLGFTVQRGLASTGSLVLRGHSARTLAWPMKLSAGSVQVETTATCIT